MRAILPAAVVGVFLAGCAQLETVGMDQRERVLDRVSAEWCGMTPDQRAGVAITREYSDEFVAWLESTCDE